MKVVSKTTDNQQVITCAVCHVVIFRRNLSSMAHLVSAALAFTLVYLGKTIFREVPDYKDNGRLASCYVFLIAIFFLLWYYGTYPNSFRRNWFIQFWLEVNLTLIKDNFINSLVVVFDSRVYNGTIVGKLLVPLGEDFGRSFTKSGKENRKYFNESSL